MSTAVSITTGTAPIDPASLRDAVKNALEAGHLVVSALPWAATGLLNTGSPPPLPWLVNALCTDEALSSAVLRIANSPSYQPRCPVMSVSQAASRLGANALGEIALAASVQANSLSLEGFENELRAFWRQALAAAVFARDLGRACGVPAFEGFACGLLHDIGQPFALSVAVNCCEAFGWSGSQTKIRRMILTTAAACAPTAAAYVVDAWDLPAPLAGAIIRHNPSFRVTESPHATVAHMATQMAASLYRSEAPWDLKRRAIAVNDATAAGLPDLGNSVRTWVDSLTV